MILAAGLGTRLKPLTDDTPKALVPVGGVPMIEIVLGRLRAAGFNEVIVNSHHHAEQLEDFLAARDFGVSVSVSHEETLLDTGGGLKFASWFFDDGKPFLVHNVDVLTDLDLRKFLNAHAEGGALASLAVHKRETARPLVFDATGRLVGRAGEGTPLTFMGVHALSPEIFAHLTETGVFSIIDAYARLAKAGDPIVAYRDDKAFWRDLGSPEKIAEAAQAAKARGLLQ